MDDSLLMSIVFVGGGVLFFLGNTLYGWFKDRRPPSSAEVKMIRVRNKAIADALENPSVENMEWMWKKIDDYDNRGSGT